jgi:tetratricopeptide (TPR) repeat protein
MLWLARAFLRHRGRELGSVKVLALAAAVAALGACSKSGHDLLVEARASLASGAYDDAIAAADAGLAASPSKTDAWGLELVKLEAYARGGNGESARQQLIALAGRYSGQLAATDYSSTAQQLKEAGSGTAAIEVLDLGKKQYPDDPLIEKMIADSVESGSSPEELEMLKSLGYIE